jgi:hypothetical protein
MSWPRIAVVALATTLAVATPALAAPIFMDDFQDGQADGWGAAGVGDVRLTTYLGNVSLRFTRQASATAAVSTRGFSQVSVAASLAGLSLGADEACIAEVSANGGATWGEIISVRDGTDDGVTLVRGELAPAGADDIARLLVRFRAQGGPDAQCWGDAVVVTGRPPQRAAGARSALGSEVLSSGVGFDKPVNLSAFAPAVGATPATGRFEGRLRLETSKLRLGMTVLKDETGATKAVKAGRALLPDFDFALVQDGDVLIPTRRTPAPGDHSEWEWILGPGRVWQEAADRGWLRAALPVALMERNANCIHNGVLTFLFRPDGVTSHAALAVASETCAYLKFDAWGLAPTRYSPEVVADRDAVIAGYRVEVAARLPVRPLADLAARYPGLNLAGLDLVTPADADPPTAYGLVVDGVHYAGPCQTRHGDYPFCEVLALPSYSTAKSIVAGVGLMRLEALTPGVSNALIRDHVPACAAGDSWAGVTLTHALDMTTGVYGSTVPEGDESAPSISAFFNAEGHAAKAAYACGKYRRRVEPGTTFVYHTTDTYLLGTAMADLLRGDGGGDLYDDLVAPLWRNLNLSPTILETRRTYDAVRQPFTGWGLAYHADDIVRIAGWLDAGGRLDGRPMLDEPMLAASLQRDPARSGLQADGPNYRYKGGFWARRLGVMLGCEAPVWTPFMSGYGGISVAMLPGGMTFYYFGDSAMFDWGPAAVEADKIKRMCP